MTDEEKIKILTNALSDATSDLRVARHAMERAGSLAREAENNATATRAAEDRADAALASVILTP